MHGLKDVLGAMARIHSTGGFLANGGGSGFRALSKRASSFTSVQRSSASSPPGTAHQNTTRLRTASPPNSLDSFERSRSTCSPDLSRRLFQFNFRAPVRLNRAEPELLFSVSLQLTEHGRPRDVNWEGEVGCSSRTKIIEPERSERVRVRCLSVSSFHSRSHLSTKKDCSSSHPDASTA
jgi:hypothetical protein